VLAFTDGLYEAADGSGEEFGPERLRAALTARAGLATPALLDGLIGAVREFGASATQQGFADDLCLVAVDFAPRHAG
jgi:serine phosphatase RsbU (regulator of sigma subunit)